MLEIGVNPQSVLEAGITPGIAHSSQRCLSECSTCIYYEALFFIPANSSSRDAKHPSALTGPALSLRRITAFALVSALLGIRAYYTLPFSPLGVFELDRESIRCRPLLNPPAKLVYQGRWITASTTAAVGESRYFEQAVEVVHVGQEGRHFLVIGPGVSVGDELVVLW